MLFSRCQSERKGVFSITIINSDVKTYRALGPIKQPLEAELKNWSSIALLSRIGLNTDLLGKPQIYISSGLGGDKRCVFTLFIIEHEALQKFKGVG